MNEYEIYPTRKSWLVARKDGLGASDAGSVLGVSKWKTNVDLWKEKTGLVTPVDISNQPQIQFGNDIEPIMRDIYKLEHPDMHVFFTPFKIFHNRKHPFITCTPDGELVDRDDGAEGVLEIKATEIMNPSQWKYWSDRIPDQYYAQVCHQMLATGWQWVDLFAYIRYHEKSGEPSVKLKLYRIEREDVQADIDYLEEKEVEFWAAVQEKRQPGLLLPEI